MMNNRYTALEQIASVLGKSGDKQNISPSPIPGLFVFSDPVRNPPSTALVDQIPAGAGLVYRHFAAEDRLKTATMLSNACQQKNILFLIGADPELAYRVGADGVHLPERMIGDLPRICARYRFCLLGAAAHSIVSARKALEFGADYVVLSSVFSSSSPSAGKPLGLCRFALARQQIGAPVLALGGINQYNIKKLQTLRAGVALVSAANSTNQNLMDDSTRTTGS